MHYVYRPDTEFTCVRGVRAIRFYLANDPVAVENYKCVSHYHKTPFASLTKISQGRN
jgi:hypothetical protein